MAVHALSEIIKPASKQVRTQEKGRAEKPDLRLQAEHIKAPEVHSPMECMTVYEQRTSECKNHSFLYNTKTGVKAIEGLLYYNRRLQAVQHRGAKNSQAQPLCCISHHVQSELVICCLSLCLLDALYTKIGAASKNGRRRNGGIHSCESLLTSLCPLPSKYTYNFLSFPILELTSDSIQIVNDNSSTNLRSSEAQISRRLPPPPSYFHGMNEKPLTSPDISLTNNSSQGHDGPRASWSRTRQHPALTDVSSTAYRRDLAAMEGRQARLAISLILASRQPSARIDHFLRICDRHMHSALSLFTVSREIMAEAIGHRLHTSSNAFTIDEPVLLMNAVTNIATSAVSPAPTRGQDSSIMLPIDFETSPLPSSNVQERIALVTTSFHLALCVAVRTLWPKHHFRRQEFLGWMVSTGILAGPFALKHLVQSWSSYVSTIEGITMLAPTMLNCLSYLQNAGTVTNGSGLNTNGRTGGRSGVGRDGSLDPMCPGSPRVYSFHSFSLANLEQIRAAVRTMIVQLRI
ncbi:hypothetical protein ACTXT7_007606 [Hymenolepis weldensis]